MRIGRILYEGRPQYVAFVDNRVMPIEGDIFGDFTVQDKVIVDVDSVEFLPPVDPPQVVGIGLNYKDHARECNMELPEEPVIFLKGINSVVGHRANIVLPRIAPDEVDFEAELVVVIKKRCKGISLEQADEYILGYTCGNDVTARDCQMRRDKQWARAKSFDTFAPIGPWIETGLSSPSNLSIRSILNGAVMQSSNTSEMIFSPQWLVSFISQCMSLYPGSIIMTGTPSGIGYSRSPSIFLRPGDVIEVEIEGIGRLTNYVRKEGEIY